MSDLNPLGALIKQVIHYGHREHVFWWGPRIFCLTLLISLSFVGNNQIDSTMSTSLCRSLNSRDCNRYNLASCTRYGTSDKNTTSWPLSFEMHETKNDQKSKNSNLILSQGQILSLISVSVYFFFRICLYHFILHQYLMLPYFVPMPIDTICLRFSSGLSFKLKLIINLDPLRKSFSECIVL